MTPLKNAAAKSIYRTTVLRGGRMTKWKGKAASLSPSLGQLIASVSPVALGRGLMGGVSKAATAAVLGSSGLIMTTNVASANCTSTSTAVYVCSSSETETQKLDASGSLLNVSVDKGITFETAEGHAFELESENGITFKTDDPSENSSAATITGNEDGINAINNLTGALSITTTGTTTGGDDGIYASNNG
ncbi:hypothetical protein N8338_00540, partial [Amylibacter sp.]|nr:hypothetical protein [Amylibacter sp.]